MPHVTSPPRTAAPLAGTLALLLALACSDPGGSRTVAGQVRLEDGTPLAAVTIVLTWPEWAGARKELSSDADGRYSWSWSEELHPTGIDADDVVVTPEATDFVFDPPAYELHLDGDRLDLDFVATPVGLGQELRLLGWLLWLEPADGCVPDALRPRIVALYGASRHTLPRATVTVAARARRP